MSAIRHPSNFLDRPRKLNDILLQVVHFSSTGECKFGGVMRGLNSIIVAACLLVAAVWGCSDSNSGSSTANSQIDRFITSLESQGYLVQEGEFFFFRLQDEWDMPKYFGNNPTSPYGLYRLPPGPGEPDTDVLLFPWDQEIDNYQKRSVWRLQPNEAIVYIGQTPPEVLYYGFRTYLFQRYETVSGQTEPKDIFASLGNTLNNLTLKTSASLSRESSSDPFNKETIVISTADRGLDTVLRQALLNSGYAREIVNTDIIPARDDAAHDNGQLLKMGYGHHDDIFMMLFRVAVFADPEGAGEQYLNHPPGHLFRITPMWAQTEAPYAFPGLVKPGTGTTEAPLRHIQLELLEAVQESVSSPDRRVAVRPMVFAPVEGIDCIRNSQFCLGDNHDAQYGIFPYVEMGITGRSFKLSHSRDDFLMIIGVNHALTGKGTYTNITPYYLDKQLGIGSLRGDQLIGSAKAYLPDEPNVKLFYVAKISRNCGPEGNKEEHCLEIPSSGYLGIPPDEYIFIMNRAYLEPETACEPASSEILEPLILRVEPRP